MSAISDALARLARLRTEVRNLELAVWCADALDPQLTGLIADVESELGAQAARWWTTSPSDMPGRSPREIAVGLGDQRAVRGLLGLPGAHNRHP